MLEVEVVVVFDERRRPKSLPQLWICNESESCGDRSWLLRQCGEDATDQHCSNASFRFSAEALRLVGAFACHSVKVLEGSRAKSRRPFSATAESDCGSERRSTVGILMKVGVRTLVDEDNTAYGRRQK